MDPNCTQVLNEAQMQNGISPLSFFGCHPWKGGKKIICGVSDNVDRKKTKEKDEHGCRDDRPNWKHLAAKATQQIITRLNDLWQWYLAWFITSNKWGVQSAHWADVAHWQTWPGADLSLRHRPPHGGRPQLRTQNNFSFHLSPNSSILYLNQSCF